MFIELYVVFQYDCDEAARSSLGRVAAAGKEHVE